MDLKKFREDKKMSQAALAKSAGLAQSTICYIETGQKNPSIETALKLSNALGINIETLIESNPNPNCK